MLPVLISNLKSHLGSLRQARDQFIGFAQNRGEFGSGSCGRGLEWTTPSGLAGGRGVEDGPAAPKGPPPGVSAA
jgi:hypothetical protein